MTEAGRMGVGCASPAATDDVHLLTDKLGFIQRQRDVPVTGASVPALFVSTLRTTCRKVMINVEIGDYGVLERRDCGCAAGELGLSLHLHGIRSHDKLTSEGMHFMGNELVELVEEVLPARFGGAVGDYQIVEEERDGLASISIVVRPEVGAIDEPALVELLLEHVRRGPSYKKMMTTFLADGHTVRVVRGRPHATRAAKVPPLHIVRS
jgi:phenylacetate-coenzyme A ligase PaaK-like adenylate-forming protein